ncbi:MAG: LPS export ABC transporter periplasmic protein LptC [Sphingorhabdus sp.]
MSALAEQQRTRRQYFAAPGGSHDRLIRLLRVLLPAIVGVLIAVLAFSPFTENRELSFLLAKNEVDVAPERMRVTDALYRGEDSKGRPFSLRAGSAVQKSSTEPVIRMSQLSGRMMMASGPATVIASRSVYDLDTEEVRVNGPMSFESAEGYSLTANDAVLAMKTQIVRSLGRASFTGKDGFTLVANNVEIDLRAKRMESHGRVNGRTRIGTFSANKLRADLNTRNVKLIGNAQLHIRQGALK